MSVASDVALAARTLRKHSGFSVSVIATLGLAVAAASTIALVADQALRRPLPYREPSRLLLLWEKSRDGAYRLASYPTFLDWQRTSGAFESLSFARGRLDILTTPDGPARATTAFVSPGYLSALGAAPLLGRFFTPEEEAAGRGDAVVLSERFWRSQFGGDRAVIGRSITLNGRPVSIVGVISTPMTYPLWADMWRPVSAVADVDVALASRHHHTDSRVLGRLRPGVTPAAAMTELATVQRGLAATYGDHGPEWVATDFKPLEWEFVGNATSSLMTLTGGVLLTLLIACINVATLLLLRTLGRERELAIRAALGAQPARLARLAVTEFALLGGAASLLAMLLTASAVALIRTAAPDSIPRVAELAFDGRAAMFVVGVTALAGVIAASLAVLRTLRRATLEALRAGWQPTSGGRTGARWRAVLVSAQLALALTLVAGAGLLLQSFRQLGRVDLGFEPDRLTSFFVSPPVPKYETPERAAALYERLTEAASALPGVEGAAISNHTPLGGGWVVSNFTVPGRPTAPNGEDAAIYKTVSAGYLGVMKGRLLRGRWFADEDIRTAGNGVIVNEQFAKRVWPDKDPVGQAITIFRSSQARPGYGSPMPSVVIGVVGDMHHLSVSDDPVQEVYVPYTREVWPGIALLMRTRGDPRSIEASVRRAMLDIEPELPVGGSTRWRSFEPIADNVARMIAPRRTVMSLVVAFAVAALVLSAIGLYGVTAFGVAQRSREFGIRMAVGATPRDVIALVVRQGLLLAMVGGGFGILGGFGLARVLRASLDTMLFRTSPFAIVPLATAAVALGSVAIVAAWLPARRAARTDPLVVLRSE